MSAAGSRPGFAKEVPVWGPHRPRRSRPPGLPDSEPLLPAKGERDRLVTSTMSASPPVTVIGYREHGSTGWSRLILNQGCGVVGDRPRTRRRGRGPERRVSNDSRTAASAHTSGWSLPAPPRKHPQARYLGRHPRRRERRATQTPPHSKTQERTTRHLDPRRPPHARTPGSLTRSQPHPIYTALKPSRSSTAPGNRL